MRKIALGLGCAAMLGTASSAHAALGVLWSDDFESYANTSAMNAVWAGSVGVLDDGVNDPTKGSDDVGGSDGIGGTAGKSMFHTGGPVNEILLSSVGITTPLLPSETEWIKLSVDIYDWAEANPAFDPEQPIDPILNPEFLTNPDNKRLTLGMRWFNDNPFNQITENIVEIGHWNSTANEPPETPVPHFAHRSVIFDGPGAEPNGTGWDGFELFDNEEPPGNLNSFAGGGGLAWHNFTAIIGPDVVIFEIDIDMDGTPEATRVLEGLVPTANGFDRIRIGGPSSVSSAGGGGNFDNVVLELIAPIVIEPPLEGDLNGDGFVGIADLNIVLGFWNQNVTPGNPLEGDPSGDGFVGIDDLNQVLGNWNAGTPPVNAVPEPATLALLGLGGLALAQRRR